MGRGRWLLGDAKGALNAALGGWSLTGLAVIRSGEPVNIVRGVDFNDDGDATADRPALVSGQLSDLYARGGPERTQYLLPQAEALARLATPTTVDPFAMIERNALRAPINTLTNPRFGQITSALSGANPRQIQFGLKVSF